MRKRTSTCRIFICLLGAALLLACGAKMTRLTIDPYVSKSLEPPNVKICFDGIGHRPGTYPFIMGGTCCCKPTRELLEQYQRDGFLIGFSLQDLLELYRRKGVAFEECSIKNHVVFGGNCMADPQPGTTYYEKIVAGIDIVRPPSAIYREVK